MLRPSYNQLINKANENAPENEPVVRSRYSIVLAAAKRARQLVDGNKTYVDGDVRKPLSVAVAELDAGKVKILPEGAVCEGCVENAEEVTETVETEQAVECETSEMTVEAEVNTEEKAEEAIAVGTEEVQL